MIVLFLPHSLDSALGSEAFHCPNRLRHRKDNIFYVVLRADTSTMTHPTAEHYGRNLKPPSQPQSDVWTRSALVSDG